MKTINEIWGMVRFADDSNIAFDGSERHHLCLRTGPGANIERYLTTEEVLKMLVERVDDVISLTEPNGVTDDEANTFIVYDDGSEDVIETPEEMILFVKNMK